MASRTPKRAALKLPSRRSALLAWAFVSLCLLSWLLWLSPRGARADAAFAKGPYLLDPRPESIALLFELASPARAEVVLHGPAGERRYESPEQAHHLLPLRGLLPDTPYRYEVRAAGIVQLGQFHTPRDHERQDARLCAYGDSRSGEPAHRQLIATLGAALEERPAEAVLHLGDFAARGGDLDEWVEPFRSITPLARQVGFLPVLGNHELTPNDTGMPHYVRFFGAALASEPFYVRRFGPLHLVVLNTNSEWDAEDTQVAWAEEQLEALRRAHPDDFIVVASHHPMFSGSLHEDHEPLRDTLAAATRAHADLVIGGHDHTYERGSVAGLHYLVSGGGGSPLYAINHRREGQLAYVPEHHFLCMDVAEGRLRVSAVRHDGRPIETCSFARGEAWRCADGSPRGVVGGVSPLRFWVTSTFLWRRLGPVLVILLLLFLAIRYARRRARPSNPAGGDKTDAETQ